MVYLGNEKDARGGPPAASLTSIQWVTAMTTQQINALANMTLAVGAAIKELGRVPSGHLYARLMGTVSLDVYQIMIDSLKRAGMVREVAHELIWIGGN